MFIAEKGLDIALQEVNVLAGENLSDAMVDLNPGKQLPFMTLDDGFVLAESLAICEYLDLTYPDKPLLGSTPKERAETSMWCRRIDLRIMEPAIQGTKASDAYEFFKDRYYLIVNGAKELKTLSQKNLAWLDQQLGENSYICGDRFSLADIQLFCFLDFTHSLPKELSALNRWFDAIAKRPSVAISQHPSAQKKSKGINHER